MRRLSSSHGQRMLERVGNVRVQGKFAVLNCGGWWLSSDKGQDGDCVKIFLSPRPASFPSFPRPRTRGLVPRRKPNLTTTRLDPCRARDIQDSVGLSHSLCFSLQTITTCCFCRPFSMSAPDALRLAPTTSRLSRQLHHGQPLHFFDGPPDEIDFELEHATSHPPRPRPVSGDSATLSGEPLAHDKPPIIYVRVQHCRRPVSRSRLPTPSSRLCLSFAPRP